MSSQLHPLLLALVFTTSLAACSCLHHRVGSRAKLHEVLLVPGVHVKVPTPTSLYKTNPQMPPGGLTYSILMVALLLLTRGGKKYGCRVQQII